MRKTSILLVVLCLLMTIGLFADDNIQSSNTASSTYQIFMEEQDKFMNVNEFSTLEKSYLFLQFGSVSDIDTTYQIGHASIVGPIYLGLYASIDDLGKYGRLDYPATSDSVREETEIDILTLGTTVVGRSVSLTKEVGYQEYFDNDISVLVGLGEMGIKVSAGSNSTKSVGTYAFDTNFLSVAFPTTANWISYSGYNDLFNLIDTDLFNPGISTIDTIYDADGAVVSVNAAEFDEGENVSSTTYVNLAFGMPLAILDMNILAGLDVSIVGDNTSAGYTEYSTIANQGYTAYAGMNDVVTYNKTSAINNEDYISITPNVGADITLPIPLFGGSDLTAGLGLSFGLNLYNKVVENAFQQRRKTIKILGYRDKPWQRTVSIGMVTTRLSGSL